MNINVAALMTTRWIARRLSRPTASTRSSSRDCAKATSTRSPRRRACRSEGPGRRAVAAQWYGREAVRAELGPRDVRVFAEINQVPYLSRDEVIDPRGGIPRRRRRLIDLGLALDRSWLDEGPPTIAALRERGMR